MKPKPVVLFFRKLDLDRLRENPLVIAPRHPGHYPIPRLNGEDRLECYVVKFIRRFGKGYRRRSEEIIIAYLCPFCDQPIGPRDKDWFTDMPRTSYETLPELYRRIWSSSSPQPRASNRNGRVIRKRTRTKVSVEDVCNEHRYETMILPLARQYYWPTTPAFEHLADMVVAYPVFVAVVEVYCNPELTVLIRDRTDRWEATRDAHEIVKRVKMVRDAPRSCGYYGERGWSIIRERLLASKHEIVSKALELQPLLSPIIDIDLFIEEICIHQACAAIMAEEYSCSLASGAHMAWLSEPYGLKEFPYDARMERRVRWLTPLSELTEEDESPSEADSKESIECKIDGGESDEFSLPGNSEPEQTNVEPKSNRRRIQRAPIQSTRKTRSMTAGGVPSGKELPSFVTQHLLRGPLHMA